MLTRSRSAISQSYPSCFLSCEHGLFGKPVSTFSDHALVLQSQHVDHRIKPGRAALAPPGRLERAACKDHAVGRLVRELDALIEPGEDHVVLARDGSAAQDGEADVARLARAGVAVAAAR